MTKTHFTLIPGLGPMRVACHRMVQHSGYTQTASRVTCLACKNTSEWQEAYHAMKEAQEIAFHAQEPHHVRHLMDYHNNMECRECGHDLFRERPRSLFSYHYVCASCGTSVFPPTETGMCT